MFVGSAGGFVPAGVPQGFLSRVLAIFAGLGSKASGADVSSLVAEFRSPKKCTLSVL